jgi:hypothetical protein
MTKSQKTVADLLTAMQSVSEMIQDLPSGIDYEANGDNPCPEDAAAHIGGLIWQITTAAIKKATTAK